MSCHQYKGYKWQCLTAQSPTQPQQKFLCRPNAPPPPTRGRTRGALKWAPKVNVLFLTIHAKIATKQKQTHSSARVGLGWVGTRPHTGAGSQIAPPLPARHRGRAAELSGFKARLYLSISRSLRQIVLSHSPQDPIQNTGMTSHLYNDTKTFGPLVCSTIGHRMGCRCNCLASKCAYQN